MALLKLQDFDPDYKETFGGDDIKGLDVYTDASATEEKIGSVTDVLVDEQGHFRYLVVDLGFWVFGKKVMLPIGRSRVDYNAHRVYALGMSKEQAEALPEFNERLALDYDHEEQVRGVYRKPAGIGSTPAEAAAPTAESFATTPGTLGNTAGNFAYDRNTYNYDREPDLYAMNDRDHQTFKLYQERLIANKTRVKTGEVAVGKRVETETARASVPIEKERVVIERVTPTDAGAVVSPGDVHFGEGEVARIEVYEETPDIRKEAFVREEVRVKKVVDRDTVNAEETLRREELDVNTDGQPIVRDADQIRADRL